MAFRFRQFNVEDDRASMKVGTDAVLLGSWAGTGKPSAILDAGTGSGIIALMLAQRFPVAIIHAIDLHEPSVSQAGDNFRNSAWSSRMKAIHSPLQQYALAGKKYDLVVSNPPFFVNALLPPREERTIARHTATLSPDELFTGAAKLLSAEGHFCMISPHSNLELIEKTARKNKLHKIRQCDIIPVQGKKANRALTSWSFAAAEPHIESLVIRTNKHAYTDEYRAMTSEFYLAL